MFPSILTLLSDSKLIQHLFSALLKTFIVLGLCWFVYGLISDVKKDIVSNTRNEVTITQQKHIADKTEEYRNIYNSNIEDGYVPNYLKNLEAPIDSNGMALPEDTLFEDEIDLNSID